MLFNVLIVVVCVCQEAQISLLSGSAVTPTGSRAGSSMGYPMSPYGTVERAGQPAVYGTADRGQPAYGTAERGQPAYSTYGRPPVAGHEGPYSKVLTILSALFYVTCGVLCIIQLAFDSLVAFVKC